MRTWEAYNIGGQTPIEVGECLDLLIQLAKKSIKVECDPNLLRPNDVTLQIQDSEKFLNKTLWRQKIPIEQSLDFLLVSGESKFRLVSKRFE